MKRNLVLLLLFSSLFILISACRSNDSHQDSKAAESSSDMDGGTELFTENKLTEDMNSEETRSSESVKEITDELGEKDVEQMIIKQANLEIKVKNLEQTQLHIEDNINEYGGYVVESSMYRESDEQMIAYMSIRIPEKHFQTFLTDTEDSAADVLERIVTGQDVTEEYVDLSSRLKSKQAVEERLLAFLKDAKKTEDLLKISSDLASVQEEIEVVVGRMDYLENKSDYATIDLSMIEDRVIVPDIENKDLNTWENTKKQLAKSYNFLLAAGSGIIVFFIGNLPIIMILLLVGVIIYTTIRRIRKSD